MEHIQSVGRLQFYVRLLRELKAQLEPIAASGKGFTVRELWDGLLVLRANVVFFAYGIPPEHRGVAYLFSLELTKLANEIERTRRQIEPLLRRSEAGG